MHMEFSRPTAKIFELRAWRNATMNERRDGPERVARWEIARFPKAECGSGWYHDAAIMDAQAARKQ